MDGIAPPAVDTSTTEERRAYVAQQWECLHQCEECGKCHVLHGHPAEELYADYIQGRRSYREVTLGLRRKQG